jgi:ABC-2 type transport system ATP-binding protein
VIIAEDVHIHFRRGLFRHQIKALNGLSLEIRDGDFFALVGQNGAGKSTAMYCFLGLLKPTSGKVEVMGKRLELGSSFYQNVAYLPEEPHYHLYLTVKEATRYYAWLYGKRISDWAIDAVLERMGLAQFKNLPLSKCSKGMKQKVGIAQCLIHETQLLFLDEPTRGLDPLLVREFREALQEIHQRGATIVMNTHVLSEIEMLANRVAILDKGKVIAQDDLHNFLKPDREQYCVTFQANGVVPPYLTSVESSGGLVKGCIPKENLYDFMEYTRRSGVDLHECALKKMSLEDSFFQIVSAGRRTS